MERFNWKNHWRCTTRTSSVAILSSGSARFWFAEWMCGHQKTIMNNKFVAHFCHHVRMCLVVYVSAELMKWNANSLHNVEWSRTCLYACSACPKSRNRWIRSAVLRLSSSVFWRTIASDSVRRFTGKQTMKMHIHFQFFIEWWAADRSACTSHTYANCKSHCKYRATYLVCSAGTSHVGYSAFVIIQHKINLKTITIDSLSHGCRYVSPSLVNWSHHSHIMSIKMRNAIFEKKPNEFLLFLFCDTQQKAAEHGI